MKTLLALSIGLALLLGCSQDDTSNDVYQEPAQAEELPAATSSPLLLRGQQETTPAPTEELPAATTIPTETTITDDLEAQQPDIYSPCEPWEIYDPNLAAAGRGGGDGVGGIHSSGMGCVRVCYVEFEGATTPPANDADLTGASFDGNNKIDLVSGSGTPSANKAHLRFSRTRIFRAYNATNDDGIFPVSDDRSIDIDGDGDGDDAANIGSIGGNTSVDNLVIRVAADQRSCLVWNTTTDREEFRSQN